MATYEVIPREKTLRLRVKRDRYYNPENPKVAGVEQCVRCNEILGARKVYLYPDADGYLQAMAQSEDDHSRAVAMGVFCAISAIENGERLYVAEENKMELYFWQTWSEDNAGNTDATQASIYIEKDYSVTEASDAEILRFAGCEHVLTSRVVRNYDGGAYIYSADDLVAVVSSRGEDLEDVL